MPAGRNWPSGASHWPPHQRTKLPVCVVGRRVGIGAAAAGAAAEATSHDAIAAIGVHGYDGVTMTVAAAAAVAGLVGDGDGTAPWRAAGADDGGCRRRDRTPPRSPSG